MAESDEAAPAAPRDKPWIFRTYAGHSTAREFEPALSAESGQGTDRSFDRLRFADPDRLRQRPSAGARRSGQGRGGDFPPRRHADAVRRHPPRLDEHLDDHQRHRALADGPLHRRRRRTGRRPDRAPGHHAKRHHQGISGARRLCLSAGRVASPDQGPDPLLRPRDAEVESDERLLLPPAGSRGDAGAGNELRAGDRHRRARPGAPVGRGGRGRFRRGGRAHVLLRQRGHAVRHRAGEDARLRRIVGRDHARALRRQGSAQAALPLRRAGQFARTDRAAAGKQRLSHPHRNAFRGAVAQRPGARRPASGVERGARPAAAVRPAMVAPAAADHGLRDGSPGVRRHFRRQPGNCGAGGETEARGAGGDRFDRRDGRSGPGDRIRGSEGETGRIEHAPPRGDRARRTDRRRRQRLRQLRAFASDGGRRFRFWFRRRKPRRNRSRS